MTYKSITTIVHDPDRDCAHLDMALALAQRHDAHLHVLIAGIDQSDPGFYYAGANAIAVHENHEEARNDANALETIVRQKLNHESATWSVQSVTIAYNGLWPFLADAIRFHDLVVLPSPYQGSSNHIDEAIFEACLFRANCPVIVTPETAVAPGGFDSVMVAWDDSIQALRATRAADPFIEASRNTTLTIIDPPATAPDRSDPGGQLAAYLARGGASVDISIQTRRQQSIAEQLLKGAIEKGAGLIVMGAYGHTRLREAILGGATRDMLKTTHLPVLMAH